jgi:hypothetical protein
MENDFQRVSNGTGFITPESSFATKSNEAGLLQQFGQMAKFLFNTKAYNFRIDLVIQSFIIVNKGY